MKLFRKIILGSLVMLAILALPSAIGAYVWSGQKWPTNTVYYDPSALSDTWKDVVSFGRQQWNDVTPSPLTFLRDDTSNNDVLMAVLEPADLGECQRYSSGGTITRMIIRFNSTKSWATGIGTVPAGQYDARGVAAHEFGHGAGFSHSKSTYCPGGENDPNLWNTMCSGYSSGESWKRTLTYNDKLGLNDVYP